MPTNSLRNSLFALHTLNLFGLNPKVCDMVIVDDSDPEHIVITPAAAIPEKEAWLFKNDVALERVRKGLEQARKGDFSKSPPDLDADSALAR